MKATKYTNKELVEIYKNLKTSAKILGFSSASDSEMIAEIELEAIKRHLNLVDGTVEETAEIETAKPETAETDDSGFEYYSVETAYEVDFRDRQNEVFKTYSEAEKTAGDNIILEVDLIVRNDKKAVSEHDKEVFEDETDEIECRCIWYHHNGVKGMIAQDTKRVIKKPETAEVSKEVKEQFEKQKTSFKFYDVGIAYQVERYVNCGNLKYVQLGTYSDYAKAVKAAQEAIESWGEENIYFHTVEFAKRSSEPIKNNKKVFKSETHEIDYYWISARLTDTKECGYVNIDSPIRIPIETSEQSETVEQTEEQHITNTETVKSENVPHKTKTILVGKDAYFYLKNEQKKQRGCKPIYDDEKNNRFWEKQVTKFDGEARLGDDSFGGGDGTYDGRWWSWTVETLKAMLDKAGYSYEDGDEIEYLNV